MQSSVTDAIFCPSGSAGDVIVPDPPGSHTSNIPLSSHPTSTSLKKRTGLTDGSLNPSKDSKREKHTKTPNTSSSRVSQQPRRIKSRSAENLLDLGDTEKSKSPSKAKDKAHSHKEKLQQSTRDSQKNRSSRQHSRSVSPQKSRRERQEVEIGETEESHLDQRKSGTDRRKKRESAVRKRNETQERESERKVKSKEDEEVQRKGEAELEGTQKKKKQRNIEMQNGDTLISPDRKSKQTNDKGSLRDQRKENKKEMIRDGSKNKRKGNESESRKDDIDSTDAAPLSTRASLVFDHPGPLSEGLWKDPSYVRILTREEVMRDVFE